MDTIVIIIVHYNSDTDTRECLDSLLPISPKEYDLKVLVIDNASKEPFTLPKKFPDTRFEVVRSEANLGFTGGNNLGIWYARENYDPDYVCLLNNDTLVEPTCINHLYTHLEDHPEVGMVCPKIYFAKGSEFHDSYSAQETGHVLWYAGGVIDWQNLDAFHRGVDEVDRGQFDVTQETDFATGCCVMLPLSVIDRVGTLDKRYFLYLEDVDWSVRVAAAGYRVEYLPTTWIWHKNAGSSGSGSALHQYYQTRNRLLFALKHGSLRIKVLALKLAIRFGLFGNSYQRRAVLDLGLQRFGKQPII